MTLVQTPPKKIYIRVEYVPRTFTISWTEKSDMSSGWTYSDDAAGLTAGDSAFDEFFGYSAVRLNSSGVETAEVTQEDSGGYGKLDITQLGTLTSGDNVMIKFPVRGIKMTKSGSVVTLSITEELGKSGYQYYAHSLGTLDNPGTPKDAFYLGAYEGYSTSNVLKSWSGVSPTDNVTQANFCTYAKANGNGYNIAGYYQRQYITALYMMKYGNPASEVTVGYGNVGYRSKLNTGGTNSQTSATYGNTSVQTYQAKLFGLEDWWGNLYEFVGGAYANSGILYTTLSGWSGQTSGGESTGATIDTYQYNSCLSAIGGGNKSMFIPTGKVSNYNFNTYYSSYVYMGATGIIITNSYYDYRGNGGGILCLASGYNASYTGAGTGARLMYMNGLT